MFILGKTIFFYKLHLKTGFQNVFQTTELKRISFY